jgi:hypothetical protein
MKVVHQFTASSRYALLCHYGTPRFMISMLNSAPQLAACSACAEDDRQCCSAGVRSPWCLLRSSRTRPESMSTVSSIRRRTMPVEDAELVYNSTPDNSTDEQNRPD